MCVLLRSLKLLSESLLNSVQYLIKLEWKSTTYMASDGLRGLDADFLKYITKSMLSLLFTVVFFLYLL